jgi:hypothetical protein
MVSKPSLSISIDEYTRGEPILFRIDGNPVVNLTIDEATELRDQLEFGIVLYKQERRKVLTQKIEEYTKELSETNV